MNISIYLGPKFQGTPKQFDGILMALLTATMMTLVIIITADCARVAWRVVTSRTRPLILDVSIDGSRSPEEALVQV